MTITYLQRWYTLKKVLHALPAGSKTCLLIKNVLLQLTTPYRSMSMLDMLQAGLGLSTLKVVTFGTMDIYISIGTPPEVMTLIHEAYATKVITKPEYVIMAREIILFGIYFTDSKLTQYLIVSQISLQLPQQQERW